MAGAPIGIIDVRRFPRVLAGHADFQRLLLHPEVRGQVVRAAARGREHGEVGAENDHGVVRRIGVAHRVGGRERDVVRADLGRNAGELARQRVVVDAGRQTRRGVRDARPADGGDGDRRLPRVLDAEQRDREPEEVPIEAARRGRQDPEEEIRENRVGAVGRADRDEERPGDRRRAHDLAGRRIDPEAGRETRGREDDGAGGAAHVHDVRVRRPDFAVVEECRREFEVAVCRQDQEWHDREDLVLVLAVIGARQRDVVRAGGRRSAGDRTGRPVEREARRQIVGGVDERPHPVLHLHHHRVDDADAPVGQRRRRERHAGITAAAGGADLDRDREMDRRRGVGRVEGHVRLADDLRTPGDDAGRAVEREPGRQASDRDRVRDVVIRIGGEQPRRVLRVRRAVGERRRDPVKGLRERRGRARQHHHDRREKHGPDGCRFHDALSHDGYRPEFPRT